MVVDKCAESVKVSSWKLVELKDSAWESRAAWIPSHRYESRAEQKKTVRMRAEVVSTHSTCRELSVEVWFDVEDQKAIIETRQSAHNLLQTSIHLIMGSITALRGKVQVEI